MAYENLIKIEKNIYYDSTSEAYYIHFNFTGLPNQASFPTLQDARQYRDAVNAEKLRYKTDKAIRSIRKREQNDIASEAIKLYPYNILSDITYATPSLELADKFDVLLRAAARNENQYNITRDYYEKNISLRDLGTQYDLTGERVRQIIITTLARLKIHIKNYIRNQAAIENRLSIEKHRDELIQAFRDTHTITPELTLEFGEIGIIQKSITAERNNNKNLSIDYLNLSNRSYNALYNNGIRTIQDLIDALGGELATYEEKYNRLHKIKNLGKKSVREIIKLLNNFDKENK